MRDEVRLSMVHAAQDTWSDVAYDALAVNGDPEETVLEPDDVIDIVLNVACLVDRLEQYDVYHDWQDLSLEEKKAVLKEAFDGEAYCW